MVIAKELRHRAFRLALSIGGLFFILSLGWILGSDAIVMWLAADTGHYALLQNIKGVFYVTVMAIGITWLTYRLYLSYETEVHARMLATTDMVTRLANQSSFMDALAAQQQHSSAPFGLLMFDASNFSRINASLGRDRGDLLLYRMGQRLVETAGEDCLVARFEADKFAVLTPMISSEQAAEQIGERLLAALNREYPAGDHAIRLEVFGGYVVAWPGPGMSPPELVNAADAALERAKRERLKRLRGFDPETERNAGEIFRIEQELRRALEQGDLDVHFQPQVRLSDSGIRGVEALVRWQHRDKGMISPGIFIPVAEQSGLIDEIGAHVIDRTFHWINELDQRELIFSINAAGHQLDSGELTRLLEDAAQRWSQPLDMIEIEVTESMALQKPESAINSLHEMRELGVTIALDDFGTGMSSLQYLLDLPADLLKIDRSFIAGLPDNERQERFVRMIIDLARDLEMDIVAEGVETDGQLQLLAKLGCHMAQGYLLARPMPPQELQAWLEQRAAANG